jgi:hypothetical protein
MQLAYNSELAQEAQAHAEVMNASGTLFKSGAEGESVYLGAFDGWEQTMAPTDFWYR